MFGLASAVSAVTSAAFWATGLETSPRRQALENLPIGSVADAAGPVCGFWAGLGPSLANHAPERSRLGLGYPAKLSR